MKITTHKLYTQKSGVNIKLCLVSDLHSKNYEECIFALKSISPDIILCAGDILERLDGYCDGKNQNGFEFLHKAAEIAPTYYSFGNHELFGGHRDRQKYGSANKHISDENMRRIIETNVKILDDHFVTIGNIHVGGLSSGLVNTKHNIPNLDFIMDMSRLDGYKILMSHHPEYYNKYIKSNDIDLVLSGHAHGGQWRIFGRGVFAPQQGLFPKYTSGIYDGRLVVSRGAANSVHPVPRIFNECEIVVIEIITK